MPPHSSHGAGRRPRPPLDQVKLNELALAYVGRFATSRAKLLTYLRGKLRERGWSETGEPDLMVIAERLVELGYVDDAAYAVSKARALTGRGFGKRRVGQALYAAGIHEDDGGEARELVHDGRVEAALTMARRRRVGPFAVETLDPAQREKAIAAMLRGGHGFALTRAIIDMGSGQHVDYDYLQSLS